MRRLATDSGGTQNDLVTVETDAGRSPSIIRIRPIPPWRDTTAAIVLELVEIHTRQGSRVIIDLTGCRVTSTAQLAVVIIGLRHARAVDTPLEVDAPPALRRLAEICGVETLVDWRSGSVSVSASASVSASVPASASASASAPVPASGSVPATVSVPASGSVPASV
ncbi:MAG: STAS domain-containing protein, partial [Phycisphaerales bacterium]|nr:STAS domain-containing protein [Phycisphaerales bacterium]